jgi:ribonuclease P protein component
VLPADHRLVDPSSFRRATRLGRKAGSRLLVTHLLVEPVEPTGATASTAPVRDPQAPARVGLVVSKAVGTAVRRNLVKRRLRHAVRERLDLLPAGSVLVVRAHAAASAAPYAELGAELDRCLRRALQPAAQVTS